MDTGGEVDQAARALAEVDAIRRRVINVVGHALRTPITTMSGMAAALATAEDEETRRLLLDGLVRIGRRIEVLLDDLLVATGVSTALPVEHPTELSLTEAVRSAWDAVDGEGHLEVTGADVSLVARPAVVARIVEAVLDNANKYGRGDVTVGIDATNDSARVVVMSTSDGPTDEELHHAFELLYRGEHAVTTAPGLGIGLSVARELARADGGDVMLVRRDDVVAATVVLPR